MKQEKMQLLEINEIRSTEDRGVFDQTELSRKMAFCVICGIYVQLVTPQESDKMFLADWVKMVRLTEKGAIHQIHNSQGDLQYCSNSMRIQENKNRRVRTITLIPLDVSLSAEGWEMRQF